MVRPSMSGPAALITAAAAIVVAAAAFPAAAEDPTTVAIPDAGLHRCVVRNLLTEWEVDASDRDLTQEDMRLLKNMSCAHLGITDLSGLEHATSLDTLSIQWNSITDLSPLASTSLTYLDINWNSVTDLSPLAGLPIETLAAEGNGLSDLSPLASHPTLTHLAIRANNVSDLSPLADVSQLRTLHASSNSISDISPLGSLPDLDMLDIGNLGDWLTAGSGEEPSLTPGDIIEIEWPAENHPDLSALSSLTSLRVLAVSGLGLTDLQPILDAASPAVERLHADGNHLTDLSPVAGWRNLHWLSAEKQTATLPPVESGTEVVAPLTYLGGLPPEWTYSGPIEPTASGWLFTDVGTAEVHWLLDSQTQVTDPSWPATRYLFSGTFVQAATATVFPDPGPGTDPGPGIEPEPGTEPAPVPELDPDAQPDSSPGHPVPSADRAAGTEVPARSAAPSADRSRVLARTGVEAMSAVAVAAVLVLAGVWLRVSARRS